MIMVDVLFLFINGKSSTHRDIVPLAVSQLQQASQLALPDARLDAGPPATNAEACDFGIPHSKKSIPFTPERPQQFI